LRGSEDCQQFSCFLAESLNALWPYDFRICQNFKPEDAFIGFFEDDSEFRNELGVGSRTL
jgi:hypothetical protein